MKIAMWLAGCAVALATASGCGGDDSDSDAMQGGSKTEMECAELLEAMAMAQEPASQDESEGRVDFSNALTEQISIALCNDPPSGQERVVLDSDGSQRCAFGLRPGADDFLSGRCTAQSQ
jgi:hypothetical protein